MASSSGRKAPTQALSGGEQWSRPAPAFQTPSFTPVFIPQLEETPLRLDTANLQTTTAVTTRTLKFREVAVVKATACAETTRLRQRLLLTAGACLPRWIHGLQVALHLCQAPWVVVQHPSLPVTTTMTTTPMTPLLPLARLGEWLLLFGVFLLTAQGSKGFVLGVHPPPLTP